MVNVLEFVSSQGRKPRMGVLSGLSQVDGDTGRSFHGDGGQRHGYHRDSGWGHGWSRSYITGPSKNWLGEVDRVHPPRDSQAGTEG